MTTHDPDVKQLDVVQDNLNTHNYGSFYEYLPATRAHQLKQQLVFHFTPKHGSWLNMAELELSVLSRQTLDRRFESYAHFVADSFAWQDKCNAADFQICWSFTTTNARTKLHRHYHTLNSKNYMVKPLVTGRHNEHYHHHRFGRAHWL
jgi:hypothetical protein